MRYYKQFHNRPYIYMIAIIFGCACLVLAFILMDSLVLPGIIACAVFIFIAAWMLWRGRRHYLEINQDWIEHKGFKCWKVNRIDPIRIERGRKSWVNEYDPYLKVRSPGQEFNVDSGFLVNDSRIDQLVNAMQNAADEKP